MSILEKIKGIWYKGNNADIYNTDDFDGLWEMEEQATRQASHPTSQRLMNEHKNLKNKNMSPKENKENINVIEYPALTPQSEVVVMEPRSFDEALEIVEELRCRRSVVLNLQYLDADQSQRVVDFLSGATHALDGHQQRIGQGVFIFAPNNFTLTTESQEARALKDAFWGRSKEKAQETQSYSQFQFAEPAKKSSIF